MDTTQSLLCLSSVSMCHLKYLTGVLEGSTPFASDKLYMSAMCFYHSGHVTVGAAAEMQTLGP